MEVKSKGIVLTLSESAAELEQELKILALEVRDDRLSVEGVVRAVDKLNNLLDVFWPEMENDGHHYAAVGGVSETVAIRGSQSESAHHAVFQQAIHLLDFLWFHLDRDGYRDAHDPELYLNDDTAFSKVRCSTGLDPSLVSEQWDLAKEVIIDRLNVQWIQDFGPIAARLKRERAAIEVLEHGKPVPLNLNDTERSICEAIDRLWSNGLDWPKVEDIAREAGLEVQTVKNNTAPMHRHSILEKGPSGHGFKVRT